MEETIGGVHGKDKNERTCRDNEAASAADAAL